ncbi:hypothetical protein J5T34_05935 [Cupriavidus gilardii]|uniref:hypothetical protein n=1 Tax=Cupriavidus gilardii TaxID=82541 RepID=UPI001ABDD899|nr:hypothetical protein [Cupriavidus gilardii]MBO4120279.1 hypothetical protein [Cupriavidus gilardii]
MAVVPAPQPAADLPGSVTLSAPHGFIDDDTGAHRYWQPGEVVTDPDTIALLLARKAPLEGVEHKD